MFDYLTKKLKFTIKLGKFISHNIVFIKDSNHVKTARTVEELNSLDRLELAKKALAKMPEDYLTGTYNETDFLNEIALYIDKRIPQSYEKWATRDHSKSPTKIKVSDSKYGLIYHFKENKPIQKKD
ncbi:hypothetical protein [Priestia megaterium]|uniref:hypothetical protein n=1 Tax=Priestia megaterium TaxID=1404 RepID=UPI0031014114